MDLIPAPKPCARAIRLGQSGSAGRGAGSRGIALFMVISAISVLSLLTTEFTYVAHVNQQIAFDSLDTVKAHYLAKSGFKLSLLRLKAYKQIKGMLSGGGAMAGLSSAVPKGVLDRIWSFPFLYPIPTTIPGLTTSDKETIEKFQAASSFEGQFSALIESESSKYNINMILAPFVPAAPSPSPGPSTAASPGPAPSTTFDPAAARDSLAKYIAQLIQTKAESDEEFASEYRDYRIDDLVDNIAGWADNTYERKQREMPSDLIKFKRAPFYSISELHMIPLMDDQLYDLIAPSMTSTATPGINVNTMQKATLRALVPGMTDPEADEFFKFRDSTEEDNLFKSADDFFTYLQKNIGIFHGDKAEVDRFRQSLDSRNIRIVTDETEFKITVQASVNEATRTLEAWVTLSNSTGTTPKPGASGTPATQPTTTPTQNGGTQGQERGDPGLKITFMRIL